MKNLNVDMVSLDALAHVTGGYDAWACNTGIIGAGWAASELPVLGTIGAAVAAWGLNPACRSDPAPAKAAGDSRGR